MNQQYLEYVRGAVSLALADIHGQSKGQLAAFEGSAMIRTTRFKRQKVRTVVLEKRRVCPITDPMHCPETRTRKKPFPLIEELTYCTSSWRRAISVLDTHQEAWLRYCYGDYNYHDKQLQVVPYIWEQFSDQCAVRLSKKVKLRLQGLALLAVQVVASEIKGLPREYTYTNLASMTGVQRNNWQMHYARHWERLLLLIKGLDENALFSVANQRIARRQHLTA
ncbi:bacteriophage antitermination protein Q [Serratia nevei]|uniref:bacteriophage antitermination protein Q n=1 Tax=Serratia nevei TaxID=2703794 RepID=UPI001A18C783|nr:antitermination protein [Serratia marcescens]